MSFACLRTLALFVLAALAVLPGAALAQGLPLADPRVPWQSADSAHFRVHYRSSQRAQAQAVARAAERVYPRITQALQWQPRTRTEIVVYSEFDIPNGFATPLPYNLMGVFLAPPEDGQLLDNSAWLDLLLVHEFTHAVHLDKVRSTPRVLQAIFGNQPWFIPNLLQPGWALEGLATYNESDPASGRGRLRGPLFEAWLRAERESGFIALGEINAGGRALPLSKEYLYGAYFFEFLARRYGADKVGAYVEQYSGNIVPRLNSNPQGFTGKSLDALWPEFLADLAQQVDARSAPLKAEPEVLGPRMLGPLFDLPAVAALPGGALLTVVDDGLHRPELVRLGADGTRRPVAQVNHGARLDVAADGSVLLTQPDICNTLNLAYDVYRLEGDTLRQLTHCAHLRRAVRAGESIVALQLDAGLTRLVQLDAEGGALRVLHTPGEGTDLTDLAAAPDGMQLSVITRRAGDWRVLAFDLSQPTTAPRQLLRRAAPLQGLRHGPAGLEVISAESGVMNVWRLQGDVLQRLTHSHTAVVAHAGTAADGSLASVVVVQQGYALHRLAGPAPLESLPADSGARATPPPPAAQDDGGLGAGQPYNAWRALYPRAWLPAVTADRGLTAYGASFGGADALGWHRYAVQLLGETTQKELLGSLEYSFAGSHGLALARTLAARAWTGDKGHETTTVFDRRERAQWLSLFPFSRLERRVHLGVGAALDRVERVNLAPASASGASGRVRDERLLAALIDVDTRGGNWFSEGPNRGWHGGLLYESYRPFAHGDPLRYSGSVLRADASAWLPLGRTVLALRATEARASGRTEAFQLGGATDEVLQLGPMLNQRVLSLRGYGGSDAALNGQNARVASVEWRTPLADVDHHFMSPAVGLNRLSAAVFFDIGGAWNSGRGPAHEYRGVGAELLAETRLLYALGLQLRLGLARGLDGARETHGYLSLGRAF